MAPTAAASSSSSCAWLASSERLRAAAAAGHHGIRHARKRWVPESARAEGSVPLFKTSNQIIIAGSTCPLTTTAHQWQQRRAHDPSPLPPWRPLSHTAHTPYIVRVRPKQTSGSYWHPLNTSKGSSYIVPLPTRSLKTSHNFKAVFTTQAHLQAVHTHTNIILRVHISPLLNQQLHNLEVAIIGRSVKNRPTVLMANTR